VIPLLTVVVGSKAYGLDNDQSDTDLATIFAMPTDHLLSLQSMPGTEQPPDRSGEGQDSGQWEVKKFMQMALSGNPTVLETLWAPMVTQQNQFGQTLRFHRRKFLSRKVIGAYAGYASQQAAKLERKYIQEGGMDYPMWKHLSHMCRLMIAGAHVVSTGEILVEIPAAYRQILLDIKHGDEHLGISRRGSMDFFGTLQAEFETAIEHCVLPEKPDLKPLNDLLLEIRHAY
jgi:hypothetical protein